ncbi:tetratricopeptide repeat protein [Candidatus Uabimicrobium sp. HlEnr_7]|uniref:tetratricopeptide repeat protein n=1 Tax=Candidatus Uabimicrobium helgolandensis TaxID=3095367 RepID=UPI00355888A8
MSKNICFIGDKNEKVLPYLKKLRNKDYEVHVNNYNLDKFAAKLQKRKIKLIIIYHDGAQDKFYKKLSEIYDTKESMLYLQNTPIILASFTKIKKQQLNFLSHVIDDIVFLPKQNLEEKVSAWIYATEEKQIENTWSKRTFILEHKLEHVRQNLRRSNFGLAISNLTQIQTVLETFPSKQSHVQKLGSIIEAINNLVEKRQTSSLVSQINSIEINPSTLQWDTTRDTVLHDGDKSKEELTRALTVEEFKQYRNEKKQISTEVSNEMEETNNPTQLEVRNEDASFARVLLDKQMISKQQLENALREQIEIQKKGEILPLCNIMLMNNVIVPKDIIRVFGEDAITNFFCGNCSINYRALNLAKEPAENFQCRKCLNSLQEVVDSGEIFVIPSSLEQIKIPNTEEITHENISWCLDKAAILAKNKQVDEALDIYNKILEFDPKNELCRIGRSRLFIENKAYGNAIDEANEILVYNPENYQSICHRGVARYYTGELDHCVKDLSMLVEKGIHNFMSYSTRGKAYYHKKQYTKAIEDLTESISRASDFVKGYIYRGRAHLHLGNYNEAICDLQEALKINPEYPNRNEVLTLIEIAEQKREDKKDE